jgi:hypothetical protein
MNHIPKFNFETNKSSINNSKERQIKNHYSQVNEISLKISENSKNYYNKKNNIFKNKISLNKKKTNNGNISFIKKNNKNNLINKSTNSIFQKNYKIFHENHYNSNIIDGYKSSTIKKTKNFEKIKKEKNRQILMTNKTKQINKSNTKNIITRDINKNIMLYDILPFNTERRKKSKIFKIRDTYNDKLKISLSKSNNLSSYINSKNEDNRILTLSNVNSYKKIFKPKNYITPLYRNKNTKFPIRTNIFKITFFKYNKFNISCNNSNISMNSIKNKSLVLNNSINKQKKIDNIRIKNTVNFMKHKNQCKLMSELKGEKKEVNDEDNIINKKEFNNNEIQEIKILNTNEIFQNNKIYKKENNIKRCEIFLFDNNEQIPKNNNKEKQE